MLDTMPGKLSNRLVIDFSCYAVLTSVVQLSPGLGVGSGRKVCVEAAQTCGTYLWLDLERRMDSGNKWSRSSGFSGQVHAQGYQIPGAMTQEYKLRGKPRKSVIEGTQV